VLDDETSKQRLAKAMGERLRADRAADGDEMSAIDADVSRSYSRITAAPLVVVVCAEARVMDRYPDSRRSEAEYLMAVQSTAMAAQNLLLAAQSEGLGACVMCAPLFCQDTVAATLDLPAEWRPQMLITVGRTASGGNERPRFAAGEVTIWISSNGPRQASS
jgi:F420 biosynthesis protein FbiB-like protein